MTQKHLSRRTLLRGFGTAIALPVLDAMSPAFAAASKLAGTNSPTRMMFCYVPNGIIMEDWTPKTSGRSFEMLPIMKPVEAMRQKLTVLTGLTHNTGRALGDGPGDHARAASTFLTGMHPKKTAAADISLGMSVDQVAVQALGRNTRISSLELTLEPGRQAGNCDSGYSCAYSNNISWRSPATPNPPETNPRVIFERMFGDVDPTETAAARAKRERYEKSVLDFAAEDTKRLQAGLGPTDRRKLDEYLTSIRDIELRIAAAEKSAASSVNLSVLAPGFEKPQGIPVNYAEHARLMFDLMALAARADMTRIMTLMMAREGSNRAYREIGVPDGHHGLTHHQNNAEWVAKIKLINAYHVEQFAYFLKKLDSIPEGDGTLLDHSMIVYGSGLADGNRHTHHDLPVLLAGRANGKVASGRHLVYGKETPMTNLFLTMLDVMGVRTGELGDSSGELNHLTV
ncbi:MAG: DUF1552 domain-containing protein [Acidobacteria bacterium]|nr:DUF1552 domain-containing protein [Acidobacteriota bacterium]